MLPRYLLLILIMASVVSALGTPEAAAGGIVAFQDDFEHDVVGEPPSSNPPGAPDGDTLDLNPSSGSITVEADVLGHSGRVLLLDREDSAGISFAAVLDPDLQFCDRYTLRWRAAIDGSVFFFSCS